MVNIELLPEKPGVYLFKRKEKILYIGKAKNLKKRVKSYFYNKKIDLKTSFLIKKIDNLEWIVTNNEIEALILENNLIKKHKPAYNIRLIDDKTYPYIKIDFTHDFPTIKITRSKNKGKAIYFGPYTSALKLKSVLKFIYKNFNIRKCTDKKFKNRNRPCLNFQINLCPAPCCNKISKKKYRENIKKVILFLKGKNKKLVSHLKKEMISFSNSLEFEKAAKIRDLILDLEAITENQVIESSDFFHKDIFYFFTNNENIYIQILRSRKGKVIESKFFHFNQKNTISNTLIEDFLSQFYILNKNIPDKIILNEKDEFKLLKTFFEKKFNKKIDIIFPNKDSDDYSLLNIAKENLDENIKRNNLKHRIFFIIKEKLALKNIPFRIDAFDIATFQGKSSVGTRVVFVNGTPEKALYRKYNIKSVKENYLDDFKMMYEVVSRSIKEYIDSDDYPDLILIDGGKGQLNIAVKALIENHLIYKIDVISIAKEKNDKIDKIYIPNRKNFINLSKHNDIINFFMKIRDEVHRFSVDFHQAKEESKNLKSKLLEIEGIGEKRAKELLKYFGSIDKIKKASFNELQNLPFLNSKVAKNIINHLKKFEKT